MELLFIKNIMAINKDSFPGEDKGLKNASADSNTQERQKKIADLNNLMGSIWHEMNIRMEGSFDERIKRMQGVLAFFKENPDPSLLQEPGVKDGLEEAVRSITRAIPIQDWWQRRQESEQREGEYSKLKGLLLNFHILQPQAMINGFYQGLADRIAEGHEQALEDFIDDPDFRSGVASRYMPFMNLLAGNKDLYVGSIDSSRLKKEILIASFVDGRSRYGAKGFLEKWGIKIKFEEKEEIFKAAEERIQRDPSRRDSTKARERINHWRELLSEK